jgi:acyl transferase domain-containing protein
MESALGSEGLPGRQAQDDIAIIGMSCIFPGAPNLPTYWQNILAKVDAISDPPDQWGAEFFYDPETSSNDRIYCKRGGYLKELAEFNPLQYGVMPSSIQGAEPGHFLALRVACEALADAGYLNRPFEGTRVEVILGKGAYLGPADMNLVQHGVVIDQTIRIRRGAGCDQAGIARGTAAVQRRHRARLGL